MGDKKFRAENLSKIFLFFRSKKSFKTEDLEAGPRNVQNDTRGQIINQETFFELKTLNKLNKLNIDAVKKLM